MKPTLISESSRPRGNRPRASSQERERGVTLLLVALAMVAIIGMAALAIDVVTLYLAREEAQRAADAGALAGARILSLSGVTGDPANNDISGTTTAPWPVACTLAREVAQAAAGQNGVNSQAGTTTVTFLYNGTSTDCNASAAVAFTENPQVQVQVVRNGMPSLFSRIWSSASSTVSATATAEVYNSSDSQNYTATGDIVPVAPRCVKPWVIPNIDPVAQAGRIVSDRNSSITSPGIQLTGGTKDVIIGEQFTLTNACSGSTDCTNLNTGSKTQGAGTYAPALISTSPAPIAVPSCANGDEFQQAVGGCDVGTSYACGTFDGAQLNYTINPSSDTAAAANCLTQSGDTLENTSFPLTVRAGPANPYANVGQPITASSSIVTLPIVRPIPGGSWPSAANNQPQITIVGFLQVFIQPGTVTTGGNMNVTVLNVAGCGDGFSATSSYSINGSSPVPVRLITPP